MLPGTIVCVLSPQLQKFGQVSQGVCGKDHDSPGWDDSGGQNDITGIGGAFPTGRENYWVSGLQAEKQSPHWHRWKRGTRKEMEKITNIHSGGEWFFVIYRALISIRSLKFYPARKVYYRWVLTMCLWAGLLWKKVRRKRTAAWFSFIMSQICPERKRAMKFGCTVHQGEAIGTVF